ncbi:Hypothetical protein PHPALM_16807 [Phytophthora palmivora]|uniref:Uncharacterized protein n=1 Tax=Phytophthora palmivora TaxID=4796 RepID=A0A2P4XNU0_9STRA|nr:Hypothetical protein PHPALM_16807 [Phytophthora palmivora]
MESLLCFKEYQNTYHSATSQDLVDQRKDRSDLPRNVKDIVHELEDRAIGARTVTYDGLHDTLRNCLAKLGVHDLGNKHNTSNSLFTQYSEMPDEHTTLPTSEGFAEFSPILPPPSAPLSICGCYGDVETPKANTTAVFARRRRYA